MRQDNHFGYNQKPFPSENEGHALSRAVLNMMRKPQAKDLTTARVPPWRSKPRKTKKQKTAGAATLIVFTPNTVRLPN